MKTYLATLLLALSAAVHATGIADVIAADAAIEHAKEARKAAVKGLSKIDRAQLRVIEAERALTKAKTAPQKFSARCSTDSDCARLGGDGGPESSQQ